MPRQEPCRGCWVMLISGSRLLPLGITLDQALLAAANLDTPRFHRFRDLANQVDMQQAILQVGATDPDIVGQLVGTIEIALCNPLVEKPAVGDVGTLAAADAEQVLLDLDPRSRRR